MMEDIPFFPEYAPTLPNVIADCVARYGDKEFLVDGSLRMTYREVERASARIAKGLLAAGVGKATRVAIVLPNTPDWVLAWWAAARIGAFTIPLSTLFQAKELSWALNEADIDTLLIVDHYLGHDYLERLERAVPELATQSSPQLFLPSHPYLRRIVVWETASANTGTKNQRTWALRGPSALRDLADATPAIDDAYLARIEANVTPADWLIGICTSGSTSHPKIVVHTHGSLIRITHAYRVYGVGMKPGERNYCGMPFFWLGGLNTNLIAALYEGACMVFAATPRTEDVLDAIVKENVSRVSMWPTQFKPLIELAQSRGIDVEPLLVAYKPRDDTGKVIPQQYRIASLLGMTESFGPHGVGRWEETLPADKGGSFGRALRGIDRKIVDPATGATLPPGRDGELYIRGFSMMDGYYKRERGDVFKSDGWFATGDTCRIDEDGYLFFAGRQSEMIKTGGANVSPQEVEAVIAAFDGVAEAIVVGLPDAERGECVVAVIVPRAGEQVDTVALGKKLRGEISSYKVPKHFLIRKFEQIPRTNAGKAQKNELKKMLMSEGKPD